MLVAIYTNISVNLYSFWTFYCVLVAIYKIFQLIYIVFGHFIVCYLQLNKNISVNLYHLWTIYCVLVANI